MSEVKELWILKDAIGATSDILLHEPTRHTVMDFVHVVPKSDYDNLRKELLLVQDSHKRQCDLNTKVWDENKQLKYQLAESEKVVDDCLDEGKHTQALIESAREYLKKFRGEGK